MLKRMGKLYIIWIFALTLVIFTFVMGPAVNISAQEGSEGWQLFRSDGYAFKISYPVSFSPRITPDQQSLNAGLEVPDGTPVWQFSLTEPGFFRGTNLVEASIVIQVSRGAQSGGS